MTSAAEVFFQPDVEANEKIATAHFLDFEFGSSGIAAAPGNGDGHPGVPAYDRFQRNLNCHVEVRRDERPATVNDFLSVRFE